MKIFLTDDGKTTITCPHCQKKVIKNLSDNQNIRHVKKIRISCSCGHTFVALLEKRRFFRKATRFSGKFICRQARGKVREGFLTIVEASRSGLRLKLDMRMDLQIGDKLEVEFWIDRQKQLIVRKHGLIQRIDDQYVSIKFSTTDHYDQYGKFLFG